MNELLQKLLESQLLNEDTRNELSTAFAASVTELTESVRRETEEAVRMELAEQWVTTKDRLVEALDAQVSDLIAEELKDLRQDILEYRDLEVDYAAKLVEAKAQMETDLSDELANLVSDLNEFLDIRLREEFEELREGIEEAKRLNTGRKIFEAFMDEFQTHYLRESGVEHKLSDLQSKLDEAIAQRKSVDAELTEAKKARDDLHREIAMESVLSSLQGTQRELMETVLVGVPTDKLQATYDKFINRIIRESVNQNPDTKQTVITESVSKTGNNQPAEVNNNNGSNSDLEKLRRLAGI